VRGDERGKKARLLIGWMGPDKYQWSGHRKVTSDEGRGIRLPKAMQHIKLHINGHEQKGSFKDRSV
jgi:hypothetical protein